MPQDVIYDARHRIISPGDWVIHVQTGYKSANLYFTEGRVLQIRNGAVKIQKRGKEKPSWVYSPDHLIKVPPGF